MSAQSVLALCGFRSCHGSNHILVDVNPSEEDPLVYPLVVVVQKNGGVVHRGKTQTGYSHDTQVATVGPSWEDFLFDLQGAEIEKQHTSYPRIYNIYSFTFIVHVCLCACTMCVSWGHLDVWGELASHKRSLTHPPSSQGWASRCHLLHTFVCLGMVGWVTLPFFSFCFLNASVLCTCISMYIYIQS